MGPAMAYMFTAYDPILDERVRLAFATRADIPQEQVETEARRLMGYKIMKRHHEILDRAMGIIQ